MAKKVEATNEGGVCEGLITPPEESGHLVNGVVLGEGWFVPQELDGTLTPCARDAHGDEYILGGMEMFEYLDHDFGGYGRDRGMDRWLLWLRVTLVDPLGRNEVVVWIESELLELVVVVIGIV